MNTDFSFKNHKISIFFAFLASLVVVLQTSRFWVLYDLSFILEHAYRISLGDIIYKDFFIPYPPGTFLIQAALIKVFGTTLYPQIVYCSLISFLTYLLTYRILFFLNDDKWLNVFIALPVSITGGYGIWSQPSYDIDYVFFILLSLLIVLYAYRSGFKPTRAVFSGAMVVMPVFFKQNTGLIFLFLMHLTVLVCTLLKKDGLSIRNYLWFLGGTILMMSAILIYISAAFGLNNYIYSTISVPASVRLPAPKTFIQMYSGFVVLRSAAAWLLIVIVVKYFRSDSVLSKLLIFLLLLLPFYLFPAVRSIFLQKTYFDQFFTIWPALVILSSIAVIYIFLISNDIPLFIKFFTVVVLGVINGAFLSQGYVGSTNGLWPVLVILTALLYVIMYKTVFKNNAGFLKKIFIINSLCITISVLLYAYLNYFQTHVYHYDDSGEIYSSEYPSLKGLALPGEYGRNIDRLLNFADKEIPQNDAIIILLPEDPFYFATGRKLIFPLLMFDWTFLLNSTEDIIKKVNSANVKWMIIKTNMQSKGMAGDGTAGHKDLGILVQLLKQKFELYKTLPGYEIYRRE